MDKKTDDLVVETTTTNNKDNDGNNIDEHHVDDDTVKTPNDTNIKHKANRSIKEKVVYKVVPVPYYYPVPVDAEWYYKHYEPTNGRSSGDRTPLHGVYPEDAASLEGFPFPPPPAYGMTPPRSALREPYYYSSTRDEDERFLRPVSPLFRHVSPSSRSDSQYSSSMVAPHKIPKESSTNDLKSITKSRKQKGDEIVESEEKEQGGDAKKGDEIEDLDVRNQSGSTSPDHISPRCTSIKSEHEEEDKDHVEGEAKEHHQDEERPNHKDDGVLSDSNNSKSDVDDHDGHMKESGDDEERIRSHNNITNNGSDSELSRKRRRFPMTFPYDQRKKILKENGQHSPTSQQHRSHHGHYIHHHAVHHRSEMKHHRSEYLSEGEDEYKRSRSSEDPEARIYSSHKYASTNGGNLTSGHYPYVMVPVRSPPYGDVSGRPPRYNEHSSYYESRMYDDSYAAKESIGRGKGGDVGDDKREIRYHPNGRRARTVFTRQQLSTLNNVFEKHPFVSGERMSELSDQLGLDRKIVKIWFQNKRQYARKKGSLVERGNEEFYYEYQDRYNPSSATPPTMAEQWKVEK